MKNQKSILLIKDFTAELLDGNINHLVTFDKSNCMETENIVVVMGGALTAITLISSERSSLLSLKAFGQNFLIQSVCLLNVFLYILMCIERVLSVWP